MLARRTPHLTPVAVSGLAGLQASIVAPELVKGVQCIGECTVWGSYVGRFGVRGMVVGQARCHGAGRT